MRFGRSSHVDLRARRKRGLAVTLVVALVGTLMAVLSTSAGAVTVNYTCTAYEPLPSTVVLSSGVVLPIDDIAITAPANVSPGQVFQVTVPARNQLVPASIEVNSTLYDITWAQSSVIRFKVYGASVVAASAVKSGGDPASTATVNTTQNWVQLAVPTQIAGGGTIQWPQVTFMSGMTESPDETAQGAWLDLTTKPGFSFLMAHVKYLRDGRYKIERIAEDGQRETTSTTLLRVRPVRPGTGTS